MSVKYGRQWKCRPCHGSYRFVRDNDPHWNSMNAEQRKRAVVANRSESQRGRARKLIATHQDSWLSYTNTDKHNAGC